MREHIMLLLAQVVLVGVLVLWKQLWCVSKGHKGVPARCVDREDAVETGDLEDARDVLISEDEHNRALPTKLPRTPGHSHESTQGVRLVGPVQVGQIDDQPFAGLDQAQKLLPERLWWEGPLPMQLYEMRRLVERLVPGFVLHGHVVGAAGLSHTRIQQVLKEGP
jgi:hypothetical protein